VGTRNLVVYVIIVGYSDYISLNVRLDSPNVVTARHRTKISALKKIIFGLRFGGYFSDRHSYKYFHTSHSASPLGTEYSECQVFRSVVLIGSPHPSPASECCSPLWILGGDTLACGGGGGDT
jgi:hypothetical protein